MTVRICMWSGPRNISTTMMRSFENRADTAVIDEPFYAHYLSVTGYDHPMRDEVLKAQATDWRQVVRMLTRDEPAPVFFQKQMCQHVTHEMSLDWAASARHFFLIRDPRLMAASFCNKLPGFTAADLGVNQEFDIYKQIEALTGQAPPVIDAQDVLTAPEPMLRALCGAIGIEFDPAMLNWPAGRRDSDGVWAPHWYDAVERSTGFGPPRTAMPELSDHERAASEQCRGAYLALYEKRLRA